MLPGSWTVNCNSSSSIGKNTSIETSESLPVNVNPSSLATNLIPVKIGIVVFDGIARCTSTRFFKNPCLFTENFITASFRVCFYI